MLIFRDKLTDEEMCTDCYKVSLNDPIPGLMKVEAKYITMTESGDYDIGGNASQEEQQDHVESSCQKGINVVLHNKLQETTFGDKKQFNSHFKDLIQRLLKMYKEEVKEKEDMDALLKSFKQQASGVQQWVMENIKDLQFYMGGGEKGFDAMLAFSLDEDYPNASVYYMMAGLREEKC